MKRSNKKRSWLRPCGQGGHLQSFAGGKGRQVLLIWQRRRHRVSQLVDDRGPARVDRFGRNLVGTMPGPHRSTTETEKVRNSPLARIPLILVYKLTTSRSHLTLAKDSGRTKTNEKKSRMAVLFSTPRAVSVKKNRVIHTSKSSFTADFP